MSPPPPADTQAPSAPGSLTPTPESSTQIDLSWAASSDDVGVAGYRVERCQGTGCSNFTQIATPTAASFNDTGLAAATAYSYRVRAADAAGNLSDYSPVASSETLALADTTAPSAPANLTAAALSTAQISLTWSASSDAVGVAGYRVERCQGAGCTDFAQIATPSATSLTDAGLTAATTYTYRVRAADAAGNVSGYSTVATATTPGTPDTSPPTVPTSLVATPVSNVQINLGWVAATDNVGVTGYRLERCQARAARISCKSSRRPASATATPD